MSSDRNAASFILSDQAVAEGYGLAVFETIGSTNDAAFDLAQTGATRTWVVAKEQTVGRGRHGRQWHSPPGNLYASVLLVDVISQAQVPQLSFVAGVALARAVQQLVSDPSHVRLKWPNDLLFDANKLGGILIESRPLAAGQLAIVVGFGVNCRTCPKHLPYKAVALADAGARVCSAEAVLAILSEQMVAWLRTFEQGFDAVRDTWLSLAGGVGQKISVKTVSRKLDGIFETIDTTGRLLLRNEAGAHAIDAGDVIFGHEAERMNE